MMIRWIVCICLMLFVVESKRLLDPPKKLSAKVLSPRSLEVRWRDPSLKGQSRGKAMRSYYTVRYAVVNDRKTRKTIVTNQKRGKINKLLPGTNYAIEVRTNRGRRTSAWSDTIKIKTLLLNEAVTEQNVVRNLSAVPLTSESVLLSWQLPLIPEAVTAYTIVSQQVSGGSSGLGKQRRQTLTDEINSLTVTGLNPHTLYSFRVQTMQKAGPDPLSKRVTTRTLTAPPGRPPRDVAVTQINATSVHITWLPPPPKSRNGPITGYTLQCRRRNGRRAQLKTFTTSRNVRAFTVSDLPGNQTFRFRVAAKTSNGTGPFSKWRSVFMSLGDAIEKGSTDFPTDIPANKPTTPRNKLTVSTNKPIVPTNKPIVPTNKPPPPTDALTLEPLPLPPNDVKVIMTNGSSALIIWSKPPTPACCPVVAYRVQIRNINDSSVFEMIRGTTDASLTNLDHDRRYSVKVTSFSKSGESKPTLDMIFTSARAAPPDVVLGASNYVTVGKDANLTCQARGSQPISFTWHMLDVPVSQEDTSAIDFAQTVVITSKRSEPDLVTSSLLMYNVSDAREVTFECVATNSAGSDNRLVPLVIYEPPSIQTVVNMSVVVGEPAKLVCRAQGTPTPAVTWVHRLSGIVYTESAMSPAGSPVYVHSETPGDGVRQSYLLMDSASQRLAGLYLCQATSVAGRAEADARLDIRVPPPPPVSQIQAIPISPRRIAVTWLPPEDYAYPILYYQVTYRPGNRGLPLTVNTTRRRMEVTGLDPSTLYFIGVTAIARNSRGESGPEVEAATLSNQRLEPTNVSVEAINSTIIQVHWDSPSGIDSRHIRGYEVHTRKESSSEVDILYVGDNNSNHFTMKPGAQKVFYLRVVALTTWGHAAAADWLVVRRQLAGPPGTVRQFSAKVEEDQVTLTWESPLIQGQPGEENIPLGYQIDYGPYANHKSLETLKVDAEKNELVITDLEAETFYLFSILAFNNHGNGKSASVTASTSEFSPSMARNVRARPVSSTEIHLQWDKPARGRVTRYHIRYWRPGRKDKQSAWLKRGHQNYAAGSLRKNRNYRFEIIPYAGERLGEGVVIFSSTLTDKPEGPPTDIVLRAVNSTSLVASWMGPDPEKTNGKITGYRVILRTKGGPRLASFIVYSPQQNFTFLNMDVSKPHRLRIAAINVNGTGVFSPWIEATYPNEHGPPNTPKQLNITSGDTNLTLHWNDPIFSGTPVEGYIIGFGQFIPEVYRNVIDYTHRQFTIGNLKPGSEYIISLRAFNKIGESAAIYVIGKTNKISHLTAPLDMPIKVSVRSYTPTSLDLSWVDPVFVESAKTDENKTPKDGRAYLVRYSSIYGEAYSYINTTSLNMKLNALEPNTPYEVSVQVVRGDKHSSWSLPVVNSTQQIAPSTAPGNMTVVPVPGGNTEVYFNWTEPNSPYGKIEEYIIYVTDNPKLDTKLWNPMIVKQTGVRISDLKPHSTYYFKLQAKNRGGAGPLSQTVVYSPPTDLKAAPSNVLVEDFFSNKMSAVRISYDIPEKPTGPINGYLIYYKDKKGRPSNNWFKKSERGLSSVILGLRPNSTYLFKIRARYLKKDGPFSAIISYNTQVDTETFEKTTEQAVNLEYS